MGFDNMRVNSGRCPPFLLGALLLLCLILTCSWWSLSTQNCDLTKQLEDITDQMRLCFNDRDTCVDSKNTLDLRLKKAENDLGQLRVKLDSQETTNDDANKRLHSKEEVLKSEIIRRERLENDLKMCTTELDSLKNVDHTKSETLNAIRNEVNEKNDEIKALQEKLKDLEKAKTEKYSDKKQDINNDKPAIGGNHEAQNLNDNEKADVEPVEDVNSDNVRPQESIRDLEMEPPGEKDDLGRPDN